MESEEINPGISTLDDGLTKLFCILLILFGANFVHSQQLLVEGFTVESVELNQPRYGIPLLQDFYFRFTSGDRNIQKISVVPHVISKLRLDYFDDTHNDEFYYKVAHWDHTTITGIQMDNRVFFLNGKESLPLIKPSPNYELILIGFEVYYHSDDHNIEEFGIYKEEVNGNTLLSLSFNDDNDDDLAVGIVYFAWVPDSYLVQSGVSSGSNAIGAESREIPQGVRLLRGFNLKFNNGDHNLNEVGILTTSSLDGNLNVLFADKNRDDGFDWRVEWAILKYPTNPIVLILDEYGKFIGALEDNDISTFDLLLDREFVFTNENEKMNKKKWMEYVRVGNIKFEFDSEETNVRVINNQAIITGKVKVSSEKPTKSSKGPPVKTYHFASKLSYVEKGWTINKLLLTPIQSR